MLYKDGSYCTTLKHKTQQNGVEKINMGKIVINIIYNRKHFANNTFLASKLLTSLNSNSCSTLSLIL